MSCSIKIQIYYLKLLITFQGVYSALYHLIQNFQIVLFQFNFN